MFRFAHPEYLNALYLLPVLILLYWYLQIARNRLIKNFADEKLHKTLLPSFSSLKRHTKFGLVMLALLFLITAISNPQVGSRLQEVKQTGIDVIICLDVSYSMMAEDIKPNRMEKAKFQIANLIKKLKGDRIGLIVFSGAAYVQIPLTTDYSAANLFLSAVDVSSVPQQGTSISSAIALATKSFDQKTETEKAIIVITDGEDHEGDIEAALSEAVTAGIKIFTIGLGSTTGVPIPVYDRNGQSAGFKTDNSGNTVLTKLNESILQDIASKANGVYYRGTNYDDNLDQIYDKLSSLEKSEFGTKKVTDYEDRFYYFLIPALLLLVMEFFISERKSAMFGKLSSVVFNSSKVGKNENV
ncbi:MAG: VWA domain-containing protein [Ignavibacteriales bacterium]|nr:MAG: VWA domain-containing protein [Ignavibacteriales bacterium]